MAQWPLRINDNIAADVIKAFCDHHDYQDSIMGPDNVSIPNPETKTAFTKRMLERYIRDIVIANKKKQLSDAISVPEPDITIS